MVGRNENARRMEVRRATASRKLPVKAPLTRGGPYLVAHACFDCRVSFKLQTDPTKVPDPRICPNCRGELHWMGRSFTAPKKADAEQWKKVAALWKAGFRFHSYRSHPNVEKLPKNLKDVADFISRNPNHPFRVISQR
jgi:hypothetical protein